MGKKGRKKEKEAEKINSHHISIPTSVLRDRTLKPLEAIVEYLKEVENLNYHEIGVLLNRNERTIWTVYQRAKKKRK